eukprot:CAMPEP_0201689352 /NCGR_PEP_ID=MMETSP0578-20130828/2969_1 /ASSEMBLY_ACC=CAM_ASM_000663 /TAXON_ID=267565 /ORGANISM="Skeletonema grethea, Strain CCMP 1804" /LENGTH=216 /DNA_ID=CAMNT_0048173975 /DNA_START=119 /DNA_END=769 /DNA_ORIENTATION=+
MTTSQKRSSRSYNCPIKINPNPRLPASSNSNNPTRPAHHCHAIRQIDLPNPQILRNWYEQHDQAPLALFGLKSTANISRLFNSTNLSNGTSIDPDKISHMPSTRYKIATSKPSKSSRSLSPASVYTRLGPTKPCYLNTHSPSNYTSTAVVAPPHSAHKGDFQSTSSPANNQRNPHHPLDPPFQGQNPHPSDRVKIRLSLDTTDESTCTGFQGPTHK